MSAEKIRDWLESLEVPYKFDAVVFGKKRSFENVSARS